MGTKRKSRDECGRPLCRNGAVARVCTTIAGRGTLKPPRCDEHISPHDDYEVLR